jgi:hypothetical protein
LQESTAPQGHLATVEMNFECDLLVLPALGSQKDHLSALLKTGLDAPALGQRSQLALGRDIQFNRLCNSHRSSLLAVGVCGQL